MTARPRRAHRPSRSAAEEFPAVPIPADVLAAAADAGELRGCRVVEEFLVDVHGPAPNHREEREHFSAWRRATRVRSWRCLSPGGLS